MSTAIYIFHKTLIILLNSLRVLFKISNFFEFLFEFYINFPKLFKSLWSENFCLMSS